MGDKHHSLLQVLQSVQKMFEHHWKRAIWVKVEIAKINHYPHSGHAYPLLVEKKNGTTVAEIRSTVWASTYQRIKRKFETMTKKELVDGLEVLLLVDVKFTASHGLALNIIDIDASYTLGAMELEKIATLKRLKDENLFHTNKNLQLPILLKRVAVISVETSKGYHDFVETLANNKRKFRVEYELFPALLQGDKAIESIRRQLDEIRSRKDQFDVVAIIRGGGGEVGLNCYDNFVLSSAVARFPLPIISGIGHATNLTVVEMVSYINLITPTALANYVLSGFEEFESRMILAENKLIFHSEKIIKDSLSDLQKLIFVFDSDVRLLLQEEKFRIDAVKNSLEFGGREILSKGSKGIAELSLKLKYGQRDNHKKNIFLLDSQQSKISRSLNSFLNTEKKRLSFLGDKTALLDPVNILRRGYSITRVNGEAKRIFEVNEGDVISTETIDLRLESRVMKIDIKEKDD